MTANNEIDIIQEARELINLDRTYSTSLEIRMAQTLSRLVDRLEWKDIDSCPIGEVVLAIDEDNEIVTVELDKDRRAEIVILGDINNDYPVCNKWLPLPTVGDK